MSFLRKQTSVESHLSKLLAHTTCIVRSAVHFQKTKTKREKRQSQHVLLFFDKYVVSRVEKGKLLCNCEHKKELFSSLWLSFSKLRYGIVREQKKRSMLSNATQLLFQLSTQD